MRSLLVRALPLAQAEASVVISGESGAGKEVLARALHANGPRRHRPFVAFNVAALPAELLESELFGHARGAFTGAGAGRRGLFAAAEGGTMFLDGIAELPLPLQAKLVRVLRDREVRRVGETRAVAVDVRVICATHEDLRERVAAHAFREDLYYRLKVFALTVPPLRDRLEDVLPLARILLSQTGHVGGFTREAERALVALRWPGNVRELANAVEHGAALSRGGRVGVEHLPEDAVERRAPHALPKLKTLAEVEREHVLRVLESCGGHQGDAARVLGVGRTTLWRKLRTLGARDLVKPRGARR